MDSIKIQANFNIAGSQMYSEAECEVDKTKTTHETLQIKSVVNSKAKNKKYEYTTLHTNIRKSIPAIQTMSYTYEAYKYWISNEAPSFSNPKEWKKKSKKERIEAHLKELGDMIQGTLISYEIFNPEEN